MSYREEQFEEIFDKCKHIVNGIARQWRLFEEDCISDIAQITALVVWCRLENYKKAEEQGKSEAFIATIARNRLTDAYRVKKRQKIHPLLPDNKGKSDDVTLKRQTTDHSDPEQQLIARRMATTLARAVKNMPPERRGMFLLSLEGLSNQEIADKFGASYSNVATSLHRIRKALLREIEES